MIRRPPRSTLDRSSAASDVYKRQLGYGSLTIGGTGGASEKLDKIDNPLLFRTKLFELL